MNVIKRNGTEVQFEPNKIFNAIKQASEGVYKDTPSKRIPITLIHEMAESLTKKYKQFKRFVHVEEIQDDVEYELMQKGYYEIARAYIKYRYEHELIRTSNSTDGSILTLIDGCNEEIIQENSNKNPTVISTQRDYMAGETSKDISRRLLLPDDIINAHDEGIIHFHK